MANELTISAVTGLTPTVQLYSGNVAIGTPFAAAEIGTTGEYVASMPAVPFGRYTIVVLSAVDVKLASGEIWWDGQYEITESMAIMRGLDPNNPWTVTPTQEIGGDVVIDITGDNVTNNTMTRQ
jgi:hypothetical protein